MEATVIPGKQNYKRQGREGEQLGQASSHSVCLGKKNNVEDDVGLVKCVTCVLWHLPSIAQQCMHKGEKIRGAGKCLSWSHNSEIMPWRGYVERSREHT